MTDPTAPYDPDRPASETQPTLPVPPAPPVYTPPAYPEAPAYSTPEAPAYGAPAAQPYEAPPASPYGAATPPVYGATTPPAYGAPAPQPYGTSAPAPYGGPPASGYAAPPAAYGYGAYAAPRRTNGLAVASLILSIVGFLWILPLVGSVAGVIMGHISLNQIKRSGENGRGLALAGVIVGWAGIGLLVLGVLFIVIVVAIGSSQSSGYNA